MLPVGFETTISAGELPQTYPLDRAATGTAQFMRWTMETSYESRSTLGGMKRFRQIDDITVL